MVEAPCWIGPDLSIVRCSMVDSLEAPPDSVITIPGGLPGLPGLERVVLLEPGDLTPILLLQSLRDAELSLPVLPAHCVMDGYDPVLGPEDREALGLRGDDSDPELVKLVVLILDSEQGSAACNLFAPILIHPQTRQGRQCLQLGSEYPSLFRLDLE
jgi:flagellar assembly factor FliW